MVDQRIERLAQVLMNSIEIKKGDNVYLLTDSVDPAVMPFVKEVYRQIIVNGGYPYPHIGLDPNIGFEGMDRILMEYASEEQLKHLSETAKREMEDMRAYIRIGAPENTKSLTGINPERIAMRRKTTEPIFSERLRKKWVVTRYPMPSLAQEAGMSTEDYEKFFYDAVLIDYKEMERGQTVIKDAFDEGNVVRIVAPGTDLTFSIAERKGEKCAGEHNVPDGELMYAPVEDSANGVVTFTYPAIQAGNQVNKVVLTFKDGKVVDAKAEENEEFLLKQLDIDEGARRIGEFGIGTNYGISRFTKNMLFDEKIGGSIHLALGNAYEGNAPEETRNRSAVHWDMLVDLRKEVGGGEIYLDGRLVQKDGVFLLESPK